MEVIQGLKAFAIKSHDLGGRKEPNQLLKVVL